ncbi:MAG: pseudouridine-5-phosphate glycosidase [Candidatus Marinimicrobia bacterium]|nr:pseudouridine-5-phosphate glycosidase [Candidatus Neomarinimicrobiota bacterium]|tara:strand:- start:10306 stop:11229 length:924 start_codon:yes stop_codon:yes gene_type:complete
MKFVLSPEIKEYKEKGLPILALESTIIAHGMPYPDNYTFAKNAEKICRKNKVAPATIAILNGKIHVGLTDKELKKICESKNILKTSKREIPIFTAKNLNGATTVSATAWIAYRCGISVFSTGGIGGVHREVEKTFDVSQDLKSLSETPIILISAGAKAILDLPKTIEALEALGVLVVGYKTKTFPAFYNRSSNLKIEYSVKNEKEAASLYFEQLDLGLRSSLLIVNPIPNKDQLSEKKINTAIKTALSEAKKHNVYGKALTPFLLKKIMKKTTGESLKANIALALNNIKLGAKIAREISKYDKLTSC